LIHGRHGGLAGSRIFRCGWFSYEQAEKQLIYTHTHTHTTGLRHARKSLLPVAGSSASQKERFEAAVLLEGPQRLRLAATHTLCLRQNCALEFSALSLSWARVVLFWVVA
jgi:hypothetical protein